VVVEDGVHVGHLIRVKIARDLEGVFAEGVSNIFADRDVTALEQFQGVPPIFGIRVVERAPGVKQG
jgi:hypothetical protein